MPIDFVSLSSLPSLFHDAVESIPLVPLFLVQDFEEYSKRYVEQSSGPSWRETRISQRGQVDTLIRNILASRSVEQRESLLRKTQNETILFYHERIVLVKDGLLRQIPHYHPDMGIPKPDSWNSFWQALLLNAGKVCEPEPQSNGT